MDVAPEKFEWEHWLPVIRKLLWLAVTLLGTYAAGSIEGGARGDLKATENSVGSIVNTEEALRQETENLSESIEYYTRREIACDLALETFSRHRDDERDFSMVVEHCHSEGRLNGEDPPR